MKKFIAIFLAAFLCAADAAGQRPRVAERCFSSEAVEECIAQTTPLLTRPRLARMFAQCLPNTLDTTVPLWGEDDTFVITGDIAALWLRDSSAQVWPYLRFLSRDARLRQLVCGLLRRQFRSLLIDPYANAFCQDTAAMSPSWSTDETEMRRGVFERKYELNSLCYPLRLAHGYYAATADTTPFDTLWIKAVRTILHTMTEQQRYGQSSYEFMRVTDRMHDTQSNRGKGHPARPCGLIASSFRASDDATIFPFLIPDNFMAASVLRKTADIVRQVNGLTLLADSCQRLAATVEEALKKHAIVKTPKHGTIYAFEVDGYGNHLLMDDANIPSLLSLPYIADVPLSDTIYQNTRRYVLSSDNPYYFGYLSPLTPEGEFESWDEAQEFNIEDFKLHGGYNGGICEMPVLLTTPAQDLLVAVWMMMDEENMDGLGHYFFKLFATASNNGGQTWMTRKALTNAFTFQYSECVYPQAAITNNKLVVACQMDGTSGSFVIGGDDPDTDGSDNYYQGLVFDLNDLFGYDGVEEVEPAVKPAAMSIYPNPAVDQLNVVLSNSSDIVVYNIMGQAVRTVEGHVGVNAIDLNGLTSGVYFVNAGSNTQKFIVK